MDHMKMSHEDVKKHVCPHCSKGYYKRREYNNHLLTHMDPKDRNPVRCTLPTCGKLYPHIGAMKSHMRLVHRSKQIYNCEKCGHTCNKKCNFDRHMESHLPPEERTKCSSCGEIFADIQLKEEHFRRVHKGLETFKCTICPKVFPRLQTLKSHLKIHSGIKSFSCEKCGQKFGYKSTWSIHRATVCGDNEEERKRIRDKIKQSQKKHRRKERHHQCDICENRKFANAMRLKDHMISYHGPDGIYIKKRSRKTLTKTPDTPPSPNIDTPTPQILPTSI
jgi:KRAB domain-containing zinc finger protein